MLEESRTFCHISFRICCGSVRGLAIATYAPNAETGRVAIRWLMTATLRILGLDPGLALMGWGVIDMTGTRLAHVAHGVIATRAADGLGLRLLRLHAELGTVIASHRPVAIAIE